MEESVSVSTIYACSEINEKGQKCVYTSKEEFHFCELCGSGAKPGIVSVIKCPGKTEPCGELLVASQRFCKSCGWKVDKGLFSKPVPKCPGTDEDGAPCGADIIEGANFCMNCGFDFTEVESTKADIDGDPATKIDKKEDDSKNASEESSKQNIEEPSKQNKEDEDTKKEKERMPGEHDFVNKESDQGSHVETSAYSVTSSGENNKNAGSSQQVDDDRTTSENQLFPKNKEQEEGEVCSHPTEETSSADNQQQEGTNIVNNPQPEVTPLVVDKNANVENLHEDSQMDRPSESSDGEKTKTELQDVGGGKVFGHVQEAVYLKESNEVTKSHSTQKDNRQDRYANEESESLENEDMNHVQTDKMNKEDRNEPHESERDNHNESCEKADEKKSEENNDSSSAINKSSNQSSVRAGETRGAEGSTSHEEDENSEDSNEDSNVENDNESSSVDPPEESDVSHVNSQNRPKDAQPQNSISEIDKKNKGKQTGGKQKKKDDKGKQRKKTKWIPLENTDTSATPKPDARWNTDDLVDVVFHAVISEEFKLKPEEDKVFIGFQNDLLGGWNGYSKWKLDLTRTGNDIFHFSGNVRMPRNVRNKGFVYKYVVRKKAGPIWETVYNAQKEHHSSGEKQRLFYSIDLRQNSKNDLIYIYAHFFL